MQQPLPPPRPALELLRDLVDMVRTPATLMTHDRFARWSKLIQEAERLLEANPAAPQQGDLLHG